ncbi:BRCT domain-containing protein [Corynebacterium heidelbergense]|uniref:BRCT domain-containing protein n=1 Tax=Corynebacterium heidelbergense TaxID=2055947 RepID=A0A364VB27_9CORY|nr:BRCT domain-containing protein [Corynebacterium heidelbergense]RAV33855.1 hypothetical protein CWC39_06195 [Corynebacterium heidelbergense]WCZ36398.1 NAD-dependent DNA ligase LigA [Corynebacterium heidelbergense]
MSGVADAGLRIPVRGGEVTLSEESLVLRRSTLASSLFPDLEVDVARLLGWRRQAPTPAAPGWIHLLLMDARTNALVRSDVEGRTNPAVVRFAPAATEAFATLDRALTSVQAGYGLPGAAEHEAASDPASDPAPGGTGGTGEPVSEEEWLAEPRQGTLWEIGEASRGAEVTGASPRKKKTAAAHPAPWDKVATPDTVPEPDPNADMANPIYGQNVTVTGDVEPYDKGEVWQMIASAGGTVAKNVTKKTTLLIIGEWATTTTKEKRARELQDKGQEIEIWSFEKFLDAVGKGD